MQPSAQMQLQNQSPTREIFDFPPNLAPGQHFCTTTLARFSNRFRPASKSRKEKKNNMCRTVVGTHIIQHSNES